MLLRPRDFTPPLRPIAGVPGDSLECKPLDQSALVLTGEAASQLAAEFTAAYTLVGSTARLYATGAQSASAWSGMTSAAGMTCFRAALAQQSAPGVKPLSFTRIPFPRVAPATVAFRTRVALQGLVGQSDAVLLRNGRAQVGVVFLRLPSSFPRAEEVRLARIAAARMATALRRRSR